MGVKHTLKDIWNGLKMVEKQIVLTYIYPEYKQSLAFLTDAFIVKIYMKAVDVKCIFALEGHTHSATLSVTRSSLIDTLNIYFLDNEEHKIGYR